MTEVVIEDVPPDDRWEFRQELLRCWVEVSNAGGAAGFPFPPVSEADVDQVLCALLGDLEASRSRLLVARDGDRVVGWVHLHRSLAPLVAHWATVNHLQTRPGHRGRGIARRLMRRSHDLAREELGLTQLHLSVRAGEQLEGFYEQLGWRVVGRRPRALRFGPGDERDEVLLSIDLRPTDKRSN